MEAMSRRDAPTGSRFGPYLLGRLLGRGGMGEVYEATDTRRDRVVALKLLPPDLASDDAYRTRFEREARVCARLNEPHVIPIHDFGEIDGTLFIDMRLVEGSDVAALVLREGRVPPERARRIVRQIASALDSAHRGGLVHRDVKPANILLADDDFAYLADFGVATRATDDRLTDDGSAVGSFAYMAPERFDGVRAEPASDQYALAAVYYEMVTGQTLFPARSVSALIEAQRSEAPTRASLLAPDIDRGQDDALARALSKDPRTRFATVSEFVAALEPSMQQIRGARTAALDAEHLAVLPHHASPTTRHARPRMTGLALIAAAIAAVAVGGYAVTRVMQSGSTVPAASSTRVSQTLSATSSTVAPQQVSFASQTGITACSMNSADGVVCTSFKRNYRPPTDAAPGCGWSIALSTAAPHFVCDPTTITTKSADAKLLGATRRSATPLGILPVLERGQAVAVGPYICSMTTDYVSCRDTRTGDGFRIAGSMYQLTP